MPGARPTVAVPVISPALASTIDSVSDTHRVPDGPSRRQVLTVFAAAVLGTALPLSLVGCTNKNEPSDTTGAFWKTIADEATRVDPLLTTDSASSELEPILGPFSDAELSNPTASVLAELAKQTTDDFAAGRTFVVTGWSLARTEVLLAVVAADRSS